MPDGVHLYLYPVKRQDGTTAREVEVCQLCLDNLTGKNRLPVPVVPASNIQQPNQQEQA